MTWLGAEHPAPIYIFAWSVRPSFSWFTLSLSLLVSCAGEVLVFIFFWSYKSIFFNNWPVWCVLWRKVVVGHVHNCIIYWKDKFNLFKLMLLLKERFTSAALQRLQQLFPGVTQIIFSVQGRSSRDRHGDSSLKYFLLLDPLRKSEHLIRKK